MDRLMSLKKNTEQRPEEGKGLGLMGKVLIKAGSLLKDTEPPLVIRLDPCTEEGEFGYEYTMPWLKNPYRCSRSFQPANLVKVLQEFVSCTSSQMHSGDRTDFCANGGCTRCGLHSTTIAALNIANIEDLQDMASPYHRWIKHMCIDTGVISKNIQFFEILIVTDFIIRGETELRRHGMHQWVDKFSDYVWTLLGVFRTCGFCLYAPMHTPRHLAYAKWEEDLMPAIENFRRLMKRREVTDEFKKVAATLQTCMDSRPNKPTDIHVAFVSLHHRIGQINAADVGTTANVELEQSLSNKGSTPVYAPENFVYFLHVLRDIEPGEFLSIEYNQSNSVAYFKEIDGLHLHNVFYNSDPSVRLGVCKFLRKFSNKLPGYIQKILEECR
jgi:hypothetical protein